MARVTAMAAAPAAISRVVISTTGVGTFGSVETCGGAAISAPAAMFPAGVPSVAR